MTRFSLFALLALVIVALALAGCGGGGGGSTSGGIDNPPDIGGGDNGGDSDLPGDPFAVKSVTGYIINQSTNLGVANVKIIFTNKSGLAATYTATSKSNGSFSVALNGNSVLSLFELPATFSVDTTSVQASYPTTEKVTFGGVQYNQSSIAVPISVLQMESGNLGVIYVKPSVSGGNGDNGGSNPPDLPPGL